MLERLSGEDDRPVNRAQDEDTESLADYERNHQRAKHDRQKGR
jgi:hypothetical protein